MNQPVILSSNNRFFQGESNFSLDRRIAVVVTTYENFYQVYLGYKQRGVRADLWWVGSYSMIPKGWGFDNVDFCYDYERVEGIVDIIDYFKTEKIKAL